MTTEELSTMLTREVATTRRVMRAFPAERMDYAPHERSSEARLLMSTFVFEMMLLDTYVFGDGMPDPMMFKSYAPESLDAVIEDFDRRATQVANQLADMGQSDLGREISFGGRAFTAQDFFLMMLHDQIHHRGQLTVYIRMAGGKVPSVYGPSADDKSTNL